MTAPMSDTRRKVLSMARRGQTGYRIGLELGISRQAAYKHLRALKLSGHLADRKAS